MRECAERFPVGTSDEKLVAYLSEQGVKPEWRQRDYANVASFVWNGVYCTKVVRVIWRADAAGALTQVNGSYQTQCIKCGRSVDWQRMLAFKDKLSGTP
jgi:hypothetical protein